MSSSILSYCSFSVLNFMVPLAGQTYPNLHSQNRRMCGPDLILGSDQAKNASS